MFSSRGYSGASVPLDAEDARAFQQRRVGRFATTLAVLAGGFWVFLAASVHLIFHDLAGFLRQPGVRAHAVTVVGLSLIGAACSRGKRSRRELLLLDATALIGAGVGFSFIAAGADASSHVELVLLLIMSNTLLGRAAGVPSRARRTLVLGALAMLPTLVQTWLVHARDRGIGDAQPLFAVLNAAAWAISAVVCSALVSQRIYGLQKQVVEARRLGQYTLEEKIGAGGMGEVYKARHALLRRPTAVKLLASERAGERALARFEREVQLTSQLTHPNTIQIYDFGHTHDGRFFYAMEYLDGITLEELVELDGPQPAARVVGLVAQICGSLAEAHAVGLIHRDVKPANVMLCERGQIADMVKVLDFGLVKAVSDASAVQVSRDAIVGTPTYMAPESIMRPEQIDARADIYAVGAVAYFLLTGRDVFDADTVVEVCAHHLHTKPEPPSARLGVPVPQDVEAIIMSCLAKSPVERPASAKELRGRLLACTDANGWSEARRDDWWEQRRASIRERRSARRVSGSPGVLTTRVAGSLPEAQVA
jgi:serine/threonine-protein kinase